MAHSYFIELLYLKKIVLVNYLYYENKLQFFYEENITKIRNL